MNDRSPETYIQANVNGHLQDARVPALSPLDRGFLYGDALYEVWRSYRGTLFGWREHWNRLEATARGIGFDLPFGPDVTFAQIRRTVAAWRSETGSDGEVYVRLQISRGGGPIGLDAGFADAPVYVIYVKAQPDLSEAALDAGVRLHVSKNWRRNSVEALPPSLKTGNYLNNILGLKEAKQAGADDVLFLNASGALTEASTRNVWLVFENRIATPRMEDGVLAGVTRRIMLESLSPFRGRPLVEERLDLDSLAAAQECFLSSSTQDVQPVAEVDGRRFPTGPDTVTRALKHEFQSYIADYVSRETALQL